MSTLRRTCWTCGERVTVRLATDRHGRLVEHPDPCAERFFAEADGLFAEVDGLFRWAGA